MGLADRLAGACVTPARVALERAIQQVTPIGHPSWPMVKDAE
jgi:hypothetical protein